MATLNFILCGLGGQGILFMTRVLAMSAMEKGLDVLGAETHGMAQRGGSVISHLRAGDVESSQVPGRGAHFLLSLDEKEAYRNLFYLSDKGQIYVNTNSKNFPVSNVLGYLEKRQITSRTIAASEKAIELDAPIASNLALLGFFSAFGDGPFTHEEIRSSVEKASPDRFKKMNLRVFDAGFEKGRIY